MIRFALLLIRTSMLSVLVLAVALATLVDVMSSDPSEDADATASSMPSLAPLPKAAAPIGNAAAALRVPLFDPEHRTETLSGSIDDLRLAPTPAPAASDVVISGVLMAGDRRRAMLTVAGGHAGWSDVGADIGGWHVAAIDAEGAVLERDGQTLALKIADRLKNRSKPHAETPPPGAGPGGPPGEAPPSPTGGPDPLAPPDPVDSPRP